MINAYHFKTMFKSLADNIIAYFVANDINFMVRKIDGFNHFILLGSEEQKNAINEQLNNDTIFCIGFELIEEHI